MTAVKTAETIESQTQSVLLYEELQNYAEKQREAAKKNMFDEVAAEAAGMAEAQTQLEGRDAEADNMEIDSSTKVADHCAKRQPVAACEDGGPEGRAIRFDDCEHTIFEDCIEMEEATTAKMEEGFRNEQRARQQAQKEVMTGLTIEENARQMVQTDLQAIKDSIRQLGPGSGSGRHCWR